MRQRLVTVLLLCLGLASAPVGAGDLALDGEFLQGGLIFGTIAPGSRVALNGKDLRVSPSGRFVLGFGRDAPASAELKVTFADGSQELRRLTIAKRDYQVQRIDGLPSKMVTPPDSVLDRIRAEAARIAKARARDRPETLFESGFEWPATGIVTGVYGSQRILNGEPRRPHFGIDIAAPEGSPVTAPADGVISFAETGLYFTGGTLIIDHGHGLSSALLHLKELFVEPGQRVRRGEPIATLGATGRATGPHLDWRINWFKERLDPALLVPPMPPVETKSN